MSSATEPKRYPQTENYKTVCIDLVSSTVLWNIEYEFGRLDNMFLKDGMVILEPAKVLCKFDSGEFYYEPIERRCLDRLTGNICLCEVATNDTETTNRPNDLKHLVFSITKHPDPLERQRELEMVRRLDSRGHKTFENLMNHYSRSQFRVYDDLFIFSRLPVTYVPEATGGGEVIAYNFRKDKLAWEFDATHYIPELPENMVTRFVLDDDRVLVFVGDTLFSLDCASGALLWFTPLVVGNCIALDVQANSIGLYRYKEYLVAGRCGNLYLLHRDTGEPILNLAAEYGWFFLMVHKDCLYATTQIMGHKERRTRFVPLGPAHAISAVRVAVDPEAPEGYSVTLISRKDIPREAPVWWSLNPPKPSPTTNHRIILRVISDLDAPPYFFSYDLSSDLDAHRQAFVKFWDYEGSKVVLLRDGSAIHSQRIKPLHPFAKEHDNLIEFYKTGPLSDQLGVDYLMDK